MDIPLDVTKNDRSESQCGCLVLNQKETVILPMKVFWQIHSVEYIRSHLGGIAWFQAIKGGASGRGSVSGMRENVLENLEKDRPEGLSSREILEFFQTQGVAFSEASLRKYVQLGLLPRSVRVGQKGKHRGSKGVYPVRVVRQILLIKQMISSNFTIEDIQKRFLFLSSEISDLEESLGGIFSQLTRAVKSDNSLASHALSREVRVAEGMGRDLLGRIRTIETRLVAERRGPGARDSGQEISQVAG